MAKKILIADDEDDILKSMKMLIEEMGYETKTVNHGREAIDALRQEKFDLVLLDVLMPEMSGRLALEEIRNNPKLKKQKVALLTVVQLSDYGREIMKKLKPAEYFQKPIEVNDFKKRLKKIME